MKKDKLLNLILPIITAIAMLLIWAVASKVVGSEYILPSVSETAVEFFGLLTNVEFYRSFLFTLLRSLLAFAISFTLGFIFALISVKVKYTRGVILPIISVMRALPTIAIVLLLLFWTNSKIAPIIVTILVVLPTSYTHIESAFSSLDKMVSDAGRVDGANETNVLVKVELPQTLPAVYNAIGSGLSLNFKLMVAAEVIAQTANSIGYMLNTSKVYFEIANMLAIVCYAVIFGVIVEFIFSHLSKKSSSWK